MEAKEFSNGLYLSMSNMGVTAGTSVCGMLLVADRHIHRGSIERTGVPPGMRRDDADIPTTWGCRPDHKVGIRVSILHQGVQDGLLGVEPVLGLVEAHAVGALDDLVRDLLSPVSTPGTA